MLKQVALALRALNKEIKRLRLDGAVNGCPAIKGEVYQRAGLMGILHFVARPISKNYPIPDLDDLEKSLAFLNKATLSPAQDAIVDILRRHGPLSGKEVAIKTGYAYDHVRSQLARLKRLGVVRHGPDGYAL